MKFDLAEVNRPGVAGGGSGWAVEGGIFPPAPGAEAGTALGVPGGITPGATLGAAIGAAGADPSSPTQEGTSGLWGGVPPYRDEVPILFLPFGDAVNGLYSASEWFVFLLRFPIRKHFIPCC